MDLLLNADDWNTYVDRICAQFNIPRENTMWGRGPQAYPCLVASLPINNNSKVVTCYTYLANAMQLLTSAGFSLAEPQAGEVPRKVQAQLPEAVGPSTQDYKRGVNSLLLTLSEILVDTGIVTPEQLEQRLLRYQAKVDQWANEDREALELTSCENTVMRRLDG